YPENLEALAERGAKVVEVNALEDRELPPLDALYIGGGFPETSAEALSKNESFRQSVRKAAEAGLPVYAECGGLMYLGERLELPSGAFPMAGALPLAFQVEKRPQGHGYTALRVERENPFYAVGLEIKGHEFHYSRPIATGPLLGNIFRMQRGHGFDGEFDGVSWKNVLALYTHVHALGTPQWAKALVRKAREFRSSSECGLQVV
ncbi:MAG: cobyrinic acid a,c-diamide synthase, partial [Candidatus Sumerlaeota bacterium]|nr:cobyrinic acid a,c-diamide synthase [Candidatus Sumerlaeota bacterium]